MTLARISLGLPALTAPTKMSRFFRKKDLA
jgi:hypothetical protein